jgi:ribosome-binding factor A
MSQRTEKIQKLARQVLGDLIRELKDPRIGFATVTTVRITPDLRHARVWVSVMGSEEEQKATIEGLESATPRLRKELGHQMRMKYLPELVFELDHQIDEALRVEELLHKLHEKDQA